MVLSWSPMSPDKPVSIERQLSFPFSLNPCNFKCLKTKIGYGKTTTQFLSFQICVNLKENRFIFLVSGFLPYPSIFSFSIPLQLCNSHSVSSRFLPALMNFLLEYKKVL